MDTLLYKLRIGAAGMIVLLALSSFCLASSVDDLYDEATSRYLLGDVSGALSTLQKMLVVEPGNSKALGLMRQIKKETSGTAEEPAPKAEAPAATAPPVTRERPAREIPAARPVDRPSAKTAEQNEITLAAQSALAAARGYISAGQYEEARGEQNTVLRLMPGHKEATLKLQEIDAVIKQKLSTRTARWNMLFYLAIAFGVLSLSGFILYYLASSTDFLSGFAKKFKKKAHMCPECGKKNPSRAEFCIYCGTRMKVTLLTGKQAEWFAKFNWKKNPFSLSVIPDTFSGHKAEIAMIMQKINSKAGHVLIVGGLGTGKSTLLRYIETNLQDPFNPIYIMRPPEQNGDAINLIASTLAGKTNRTHKYSLMDLQALCEKHKDKVLIILVDEAHECNEDFEQFLRSLGDFQNVYLVFAGISQTREKFKRDMPALFDRIVETIWLGSLNHEEVKELIQKRIVDAGGAGITPFTGAAIDEIYSLSSGIPRGVLKICDWIITEAVEKNYTMIDKDQVALYKAFLASGGVEKEIEAQKIADPEPKQEPGKPALAVAPSVAEQGGAK